MNDKIELSSTSMGSDEDLIFHDINFGTMASGSGSTGQILTTHGVDTISITGAGTGYTYSPVTGSNGISAVDWSNTISVTSPVYGAMSNSGKLTLNGENADININGVSLVDTLKSLQDRLNILRPNVELEDEWDELRELGEKYRQLETELLEKKKMWEALKKTSKRLNDGSA